MSCFRICLLACTGLLIVASGSAAQSDTLHITPESLSPRGAFLRSTIAPGWGQWYNRKIIKGSILALTEAGLIAGILLQRDRANGGLKPAGNRMLLGLIGVHLFGMADAYVDAHLTDFDRPDEFGRHGARAGPALAISVTVRW